MELKRALELRTEYEGNSGIIRVDKDEYICLNEMLAFFPSQDMSNWIRSPKTQEFIKIIENELKSVDSTYSKKAIFTKRGNGGGTWAVPILAFEFATWLSPEFKYKVFTEYINGTQHKKDWNIKRIHAAYNYKFMTASIKNAHEEPKPYHFSNEALMLNEIVFGVRDGLVRDTASEEQLDQIAYLEGYNAVLIDLGMDYQTRKEKLVKTHLEKTQAKLTN